MGGDVTVVSTLGEGSAFTLEVPLETGQATPEMGFQAAPALNEARVLVAEDDAALRRLIGMQLERLGIDPVLVKDGQMAVEAAARPPSTPSCSTSACLSWAGWRRRARSALPTPRSRSWR